MNLSQHQQDLIDQGLARWYRGRLIPVIAGGSGEDEPEALFPGVPVDLTEASAEDLEALAVSIQERLSEIASDPASFVSDELSADDLVAAATDARASIVAIRSELAARDEEPDEEEPEPEAEEEPEAEAAAEATALQETLSALADVPADETPAEETAEVLEAVTASGITNGAALVPTPAVARSRAARPAPAGVPTVSLTASTGSFSGVDLGSSIDEKTLGDMMIQMHRQFGDATGQRHPLAKANWADRYPRERQLGGDVMENMALIAAATDQTIIRQEMNRRQKSLTASGGWCAPVTPYYELQTLGTSDRPVRDALPGFNASRGGIKHATPPSLAGITDAVGIVTAAEDEQGGTFGAKSCQVPDCPDFTDVQANAVFHCLQWGNMISRAFPELVASWNDLTMTALARLAESHLLTRIDAMSTAVTTPAASLGATATQIPQLVAAAVAMRSRHRMAPDAVLRLLAPAWVAPMWVTDVIKSQFQRFDTDQAKLTALLRSFNIEPTWYLDGATGRGQVFGAQTAGALLTFPSTAVSYLYPEGTFIYLDAGTLEIGLVRDSILNANNDFQTFGEIFEEVAKVGVESLAIIHNICPSGTVAIPDESTC